MGVNAWKMAENIRNGEILLTEVTGYLLSTNCGDHLSAQYDDSQRAGSDTYSDQQLSMGS